MFELENQSDQVLDLFLLSATLVPIAGGNLGPGNFSRRSFEPLHGTAGLCPTVTNSERKPRMVRSRLGLKALVLSGLVLGLMAFATSAAQAEVIKNAKGEITAEANWMVKGTNVTKVLLPEVQVKELEGKTASLLFTTGGGTKVEILCTSAVLAENVKLTLTGSLSLGKATFHNCLTKLNGSLSKPCEPFTGEGASLKKGLVESLKATGLIILHNGEGLVKLTPDDGSVFAHLKLGEECSIGEEVLVTGALTVKDCVVVEAKCTNKLTTESVTHLIVEGPLSSLLALGQPATIDGSAIVELVGAHSTMSWSGLPA
jgi:hypothetical protein